MYRRPQSQPQNPSLSDLGQAAGTAGRGGCLRGAPVPSPRDHLQEHEGCYRAHGALRGCQNGRMPQARLLLHLYGRCGHGRDAALWAHFLRALHRAVVHVRLRIQRKVPSLPRGLWGSCS